MSTITNTSTRSDRFRCEQGWAPANVTRSLLGWGVVAGPFYVLASLAQALTRDGFDLGRHQWSLLENGDWGWVQVTNFLLTGAMLLCFAVGQRRALRPGRAARSAPILAAVFGISLVGAAIFTADPALGFPVGTPNGAATVTTSGLLHFAFAGVGFLAIAASCLVMGSRYRADGRRAMATFSRVTAVAFLAGFLAVASGSGSVVANLAFTAAVILIFTWISVTATTLYRSVSSQPSASL